MKKPIANKFMAALLCGAVVLGTTTTTYAGHKSHTPPPNRPQASRTVQTKPAPPPRPAERKPERPAPPPRPVEQKKPTPRPAEHKNERHTTPPRPAGNKSHPTPPPRQTDHRPDKQKPQPPHPVGHGMNHAKTHPPRQVAPPPRPVPPPPRPVPPPPRHHHHHVGSILGGLLFGTVVVNQAADESYDDFAKDVLTLVNYERSQRGIAPLRLSRELMNASAIRVDEITRLFSHTRPNGQPCSSLIRDGAYTVGENIAAGLQTPEAVVEQWMNSPGHRANILNSDYEELGVGYTYKPDSEYHHYWVQMFRRPLSKAVVRY